MIYDSLQKMIQDIRAHTSKGMKVIQYDNPLQLMIGYYCEKTKQEWNCKIRSLKADPTLAKYFGTHAGRNEFIKYLNWEKLKL